MPDERLPIKIFAQREEDNLKIEGGGTGELPKWVTTDENILYEKSINFIKNIEVLEDKINKKEKNQSLVPLILKAKVINDASAKSHRKEINNLLRISTTNNILGLDNENELIFKIENRKESKVFIDRLKDYKKYNYALSCLDNIEEFSPHILFEDKKTPVNYKVKLLDFQNFELNHYIRLNFEKLLKLLNFDFVKTNYTQDHIIYNLKSLTLDGFNNLKVNEIYDAIFSIEPMPKFRIHLDFSSTNATVRVKTPEDGKKYVTVGVLDSGIKNIEHFNPWLTSKWTVYPEESIDRSHGTFVAGIILYGDELEQENWVGLNGNKIFDANIFPDLTKETIDEDELIRNIQEVIKENHKDIKIWNLSISIATQIDEINFSDFAVALDEIQDQYNVLICKSTGNCDNYKIGLPKGKIYQGADSIRSIVVGSLANRKSVHDFAEIDNPSPFTRVGRGPSYIIKPDIVHYGGNTGLNSRGEPVVTGVNSFGISGELVQNSGTSFSTPRITAIAAGLHQELAEDFNPLLIKGLIIHSAYYPKLLQLPNPERLNQIGFGKPKKVTDIIYNSFNEATLILKDELSRGDYIDIMDFPMPDCLIQDGYYTGQIIVTLVYNPIIEPSQRAEYCQSNIDIKMGTYDHKKNRDTERKNILNPFGREGSLNILLEKCYSKRKINNNLDDFALKERLLVQYGDKYYPVKKYAVNLTETTDSFRERYLNNEKKWFLLLRGLFREHIEVKSQIESKDLSQEFCLLITLRDPTGTKPVYNEVTKKLDLYNFWHSNIKVQSDIEIHL